MEFIYNKKDNKITLELDFDLIKCAFEGAVANTGYRIKNKKKFMEQFCKYMNEVEDSETGLTPLQSSMDYIFDEMICDDLDCIKEVEEDK